MSYQDAVQARCRLHRMQEHGKMLVIVIVAAADVAVAVRLVQDHQHFPLTPILSTTFSLFFIFRYSYPRRLVSCFTSIPSRLSRWSSRSCFGPSKVSLLCHTTVNFRSDYSRHGRKGHRRSEWRIKSYCVRTSMVQSPLLCSGHVCVAVSRLVGLDGREGY